MARYKMFIEYDGTNYNGWQIQPDDPTVEEELEKALSRILQEDIDIIGQGRTDSGVHAEAQIAHVDIEKPVIINDLLYALLGVLPRDISVWSMEKVKSDFHARFHGKARQYRYQITTRPSAMLYRFSEFVRNDLDVEAMQKCAQILIGEHDFDCFSKSDNDQKNAICTIEHSEFNRQNHLLIYRIRANRFVHHMVRRLIGTMLQVGKSERTVDYFSELLHHPNPDKTSYGASAKGLILEEVAY